MCREEQRQVIGRGEKLERGDWRTDQVWNGSTTMKTGPGEGRESGEGAGAGVNMTVKVLNKNLL